MARTPKSSKPRAGRKRLTVSHRARLIDELRSDPKHGHYGIRPFPKRGNAAVTNELVNKLREGDAY